MTGAVSRADMLAYLEEHETSELNRIADCFGFETPHPSPQTQTKLLKTVNQSKPAGTEEKATTEIPQPTLKRPAERFYDLKKIEPSQLAPEVSPNQSLSLPGWITDENLPPLDLATIKRGDTRPPTQQPLIAKQRLWPVLRMLLSETRSNKRPNLPRLVKIVANGYFPNSIPYQQHTSWATNTHVLLDFPQHLRLFASDYAALLQ